MDRKNKETVGKKEWEKLSTPRRSELKQALHTPPQKRTPRQNRIIYEAQWIHAKNQNRDRNKRAATPGMRVSTGGNGLRVYNEKGRPHRIGKGHRQVR